MSEKTQKSSEISQKSLMVAFVFCVLIWAQTHVYASNQSEFDQTINAGSLSVDIVDGSGNTVGSPSVSFASKSFSFDTQTSAGTLGTASEKIRAANPTATDTWTVNLAGSATTASWTSGSDHYDFNDANGSGYTDGADADSVGGQLTVDPSGGTITGVSGCSTSNVSVGASDSFVEGSTNSIDLMSATTGAATSCRWDLTGVSLSQKIPAAQNAGSYALTMVLSIQ
jgi:hypothetical protein